MKLLVDDEGVRSSKAVTHVPLMNPVWEPAPKFELPVIETGARGAEKWLEPKWHQFTTAPKRVSITYEQSRPPLR